MSELNPDDLQALINSLERPVKSLNVNPFSVSTIPRVFFIASAPRVDISFMAVIAYSANSDPVTVTPCASVCGNV